MRVGHRRAGGAPAHRARRRGRRPGQAPADAVSSSASFIEVDLADPDRSTARGRGHRRARSTRCSTSPGCPRASATRCWSSTINFLGLRHLTEALIPRWPPGSSIVSVSSLAAAGLPGTSARRSRRCWRHGDDARGHRLVRATTPTRWPTAATGCPRKRSSSTPCAAPPPLGARGIRINCTGPGVTETPILDQLRIGLRARAISTTSPSRWAGCPIPAEQAAVLVFLNSRRRQLHHRARSSGSTAATSAPRSLRELEEGTSQRGRHDRLPASRRRRPQLGAVGRRRRARHAELHHRREGRRRRQAWSSTARSFRSAWTSGRRARRAPSSSGRTPCT